MKSYKITLFKYNYFVNYIFYILFVLNILFIDFHGLNGSILGTKKTKLDFPNT